MENKEFTSTYFPEFTSTYFPVFRRICSGTHWVLPDCTTKTERGIRGIVPVDIWRRVTGNAIVRATQQITAKTCTDTYSNFKQLALSKDGVSHCLYFLDTAYNDPSFTSEEDSQDPMVIMKFDTKNAFGSSSLDARLVLDVLSGKVSRDYECGIKSGEDFETAVHELRTYFGFLYIGLLPFTSGDKFSRCFPNFEVWLTQTT
jgi:hypothetical protein